MLLHFLIAITLYVGLYLIGEIKVLPNAENIIAWDAINYFHFQHRGYIDFQQPTSNIPFFPLVALIWRWFSLSPMAASFLNIGFFLSGLYLLHRKYQFSFQTLLLFLSIPSIFFLCVPYAEALFFLSTTLVILGLGKKNNWWVIVGLFIASMTRPSAMFFFPALIFMEIVSLKNWKWNVIKSALGRISLYFLTVMTGLLIVFSIQHEATGDWLAFFHQRTDNGFKIPVFPLTTWRGAKLLWLDGLAFAIAFASVLYCGFLFWKKTIRQKVNFLIPSKAILFSLAFLSMTVVHILFFNNKEVSETSSLFGLNRFVFATSFFLILFSHYRNRFDFSQKINKQLLFGYLVLILAMIGVFHPSNQPEYLRPLIYLLFITAFLFFQKRFTKYWILVYGVHVVCQVLLFDKFLRGIWVG